MIAIGCLAPLIFAVIGGLAGHWIAGLGGVPWGFGAGLTLGGVMLAGAMTVMARVKSGE